MSPRTSDPGSYTRPQGSAPDRRARKSRRDGHSYNRCIRPAPNHFVITCSEANAQHNAPFVVLVLARAILLVLNGVRELVTDVAVRADLAAFVPLLSSRSPSVRIHTRVTRQKKDGSTPCGPLDTPCSSPCARTNAQSHRHRTCACPLAQNQEIWRRRGPHSSRPDARAVQAARTSVMSSPGQSTERAHECARRAVGFSCISDSEF